MISPDFRDLLFAYNAQGVEYLVVGAHALAAHGLVLTVTDLSEKRLIFRIGVEPTRIDIVTAVDGVEFAEAWRDHITVHFADQPAQVLSRGHLLANKRAAERPQDLVDADWLERETPSN